MRLTTGKSNITLTTLLRPVVQAIVLALLWSFTTVQTLQAQTLPNIEHDLYERETGVEPRLIVWERPEQTTVAVSVIIRFSESDYASYGDPLPALIARLYDAAIPRTALTEQVGITFLHERDSILNKIVEAESHSNAKNTSLLATYSDRERYLEEKTAPLLARLRSSTKLVRSPAIPLASGIIIHYSLTPDAVDGFLSQLRDRFEHPIWLDEWTLKTQVNSGYPSRNQTQLTNLQYYSNGFGISTALPSIDGRLLPYWHVLLQHATIAVAMVGKTNGEEIITLANLYWSSWQREPTGETVEQRVTPAVKASDNYRLTLTLPVRNRDVLVAWLTGASDMKHNSILGYELTGMPVMVVSNDVLDTVITAEQRRKQWAAKLQLDLDQPETAADRLAVAMADDGWQRWYAIDDRLSDFDNTPEAEWVHAWRMRWQESLR